MVNPEYQWPACWIRNEILKAESQTDPIRLATDQCEYRRAVAKRFVGSGDVYVCTHPAIQEKSVVEQPKVIENGGIMTGGSIDDFKTFCVPVDMSKVAHGYPSELAIDVQCVDVPIIPKQLRSSNE